MIEQAFVRITKTISPPEGSFDKFKDSVANSPVPVEFHIALFKLLTKHKGQGKNVDEAILLSANQLFEFDFENVHEASTLVHYFSSVSLLKKMQVSPPEQEGIFESAIDHEFRMSSACLTVASIFSDKSPNIKVAFLKGVAKTSGEFSNLDRIGRLIASAEHYFSEPQKRARIVLLAQ